MQNSKLIQLLRLLSQKELDAFDRHLEAQYGGQKKPIELFNYVKGYHRKYESEELKRAHIINLLSIEGKDKKKILSHQANLLLKWLENFLIWQKMKEKNNHARQLLLAEIYEDKNQLDKKVEVYEKLKDDLEKKEDKSQFDFFELTKIRQQLYYDKQDQLYKPDSNTLKTAIRDLNVFYAVSRLQYRCELLSRSNFLKENGMIDSVYIDSSIIDDPIIRMHALLANALEDVSLRTYTEAKKFFFQHYQKIGFTDNERFISYLINIVGILSYTDEEKIYELFELYKQNLKLLVKTKPLYMN